MKPLEKLVSNVQDVLALFEYLRVVAFRTTALFVCSPLKLLAIALLTEIACKRADLKETKQGKKLADSILYRSTRQTPFVSSLQGKTGLGNTSRTLLYKGLG